MSKKNFVTCIKEKIISLLPTVRTMLTDEEQRSHIQFVYLFGALSLVSGAMTVMNIFTEYRILMWQTLIFMVANIANTLLEIHGSSKVRKITHIGFALEFMLLLTMFIYVGQPMGFSAIWAALLPACGLILYRLKWGTVVAMSQFIILAFSFWTPWGQALLPDVYTDAFKMRFPVLYMAFFIVSVFFEVVRYYTQSELERARDYFKQLFSDGEIKAERERKLNYDIIRTLTTAFSSVYYLNINTERTEKYTLSNQHGEFDMGLPYTDMIAEYIRKCVFEDDAELFRNNCAIETIRTALMNQKIYQFNYRIRTADEPRYYEVKFIKVGADDAVPENVVIGLSDVDHIVREEKAQQEALEAAMHEAQVASEAKTKFLFNMSHDIRTPMNAIMGFTEMAQNHIDDTAKVSDCLSKVSISGEHLLKLINDVLDMSRIDNGKVEIEPVSARLYDSGDKIMAIVEQSARDKNIAIKFEYFDIVEDNLYIDTLRLDQILINIVNNSIKYTPCGGHISCRVVQHGISADGIVNTDFIVEDDGIGMSEEFVKQIFESFSRARNSTVSGIQGTGLGMTITKRLVELMKGTIKVESQENVGTTVTVSLPLKQSFEQPVEAPVEDHTEEIKKHEDVHILLVDDNELNREIAHEILADEGYNVIEADDGTTAVAILKEKGATYFTIVLMDVQMPIMNGYDATKEIRSWGGDFLKLPIIALTANAFEEDRRTALEMGMNGHLAKPIDTSKLIKVINGISDKK